MLLARGQLTLASALFAAFVSSFAFAAEKATPAAAAKPAAQAPKPAAATTKAPATAPATPAAPASAPIREEIRRASNGVVIIERAGRIVGIGSVLHGDGRVLTAFSAVVQGGDFEVRYSDGSVARAHITHSDRPSDLALLTVNGEPRKQGLKASRSGADAKAATTFSLAPGKKLTTNSVALKGPASFVATSGKPIANGLEISETIKPTDVGAPLLNDAGEVVAIVARACPANSKAKCAPRPYAATVNTVRAFLRGALGKPQPTRPAAAPKPVAPPTPWLGVDIIPATVGPVRGGRITHVHPESPAAAAGLKAGNMSDAEVLVAVEGVPVASANGLSTALRQHKVGETVELLLFGAGRFRHVSLLLQSVPPTASPVRTLDPWPTRNPAGSPKTAPNKPAPAPTVPRNR